MDVDLRHLQRDIVVPLTRFVKRSRVRPTEEQIAHALGLLEKLHTALVVLAHRDEVGTFAARSQP